MTTSEPGDAADFEALLEDLKATRGFDFTGYKRASLRRRVTKRMREIGIDGFGDYRDHLQVRPEEFIPLFNTILINVTRFFRDVEHWDYLRDEILPRVVEHAGEGPIRVWSAGCASGEEPYSVAMLLAELIGTEAFDERVKIYATDADEEALTTARRASYDPAALESVPEDLQARHFHRSGAQYVFSPDLRRAVIFGRHDLVSDAPISHLDLLVCRNVLMYFNAETQGRILRHLHFGLDEEGYLFLGKAEMLLTRTELFEPVDLSHRIFRKVLTRTKAERAPLVPPNGLTNNHVMRHLRLRDAAFAAAPTAQVVIDLDDVLIHANQRAQTLFGLGPHDIGRGLRDLELSYRPVELHAPIERAYEEGRAVQLRNVTRTLPDGESQSFDIWVIPLEDNDGRIIGVSVTFDDVTRYEDLRTRLQQSNQELETAYEELQSTNEELETTNEELQSTNEELETTNEELQSSNEELETMNEELQSANAEQEDINRELQLRTEEVERLNAYLRAIMSSFTVGVVAVDGDFGVRLWNDQARELWGLRSDEVVGRSLLNLDIGLDVAEFADPIRLCLAGDEPPELDLPATNRCGQDVDCRVVFSPLADDAGKRNGVVILMEANAAGAGE